MEEGAPHLFVGVLVVPHRVIESAQKFFATYLVCAPIYEFLYERPHSFIVRNGESVCVWRAIPTSLATRSGFQCRCSLGDVEF